MYVSSFYSYALTIFDDPLVSECVKYHHFTRIGFAESTLYQELYYEIKLPEGLIGYGYSAKGVCFLYPDSQVICAFTETVWLMRTQIGVITATWSLTIRVIHLILLYFVILTIFLITPEMYLKCLARTSFMIMYTGMMIMILKMQLIYIEYTSIISYGNMLQMVMKTT